MREWPLVVELFGSMGHFKFKGANPASRSPRNIPTFAQYCHRFRLFFKPALSSPFTVFFITFINFNFSVKVAI